ncbi:hypothetical protein KIL84_000574 [Mauremys mutica]|uniref:Uncharacterized protein n=1 Tax=Mauremys mutica TaxID=74926 RepID=A0A9D4AT81_9SAUR|nr:hypothetical protein KIL84_000574 [Mauremys mutica]
MIPSQIVVAGTWGFASAHKTDLSDHTQCPCMHMDAYHLYPFLPGVRELLQRLQLVTDALGTPWRLYYFLTCISARLEKGCFQPTQESSPHSASLPCTDPNPTESSFYRSEEEGDPDLEGAPSGMNFTAKTLI